MTARDLILDIAVNLSRLGRFILENRTSRVHLFALETKNQLTQLSSHHLPRPLRAPIFKLTKLIDQMIIDKRSNTDLADSLFTYAAILTHRAKLA
jgi:hypothetical protein